MLFDASMGKKNLVFNFFNHLPNRPATWKCLQKVSINTELEKPWHNANRMTNAKCDEMSIFFLQIVVEGRQLDVDRKQSGHPIGLFHLKCKSIIMTVSRVHLDYSVPNSIVSTSYRTQSWLIQSWYRSNRDWMQQLHVKCMSRIELDKNAFEKAV